MEINFTYVHGVKHVIEGPIATALGGGVGSISTSLNEVKLSIVSYGSRYIRNQSRNNCSKSAPHYYYYDEKNLDEANDEEFLSSFYKRLFVKK